MTEKQLMQGILDCARLLQWKAYHTFDSRHSEAGFPDVVLSRGPRLIFAETKSAKGKLSWEQSAWLLSLEQSGAEVAVWRPEDWLDGTIEAVLR